MGKKNKQTKTNPDKQEKETEARERGYDQQHHEICIL